MKLSDFELTKEQKRACKRIERAIKAARALGLDIIAKCEYLNAYRSDAMEHAVPLTARYYDNSGEMIPYERCGNINDAGADDMEFFKPGFITEV